MGIRALTKGTPVRVVAPVITGSVVRADTNGEDFGYVVAFELNGEQHERFFKADEVEENKEAA